MRILRLLTIISAVLMQGCEKKKEENSSSVMSEQAFSELYSQKLISMEPELRVVNAGNMMLKLSYKKQEEQTAFLNNAYNAYKTEPSSLDSIIERFVKASLETVLHAQNDEINLKQIVPVIKDSAYPGEIKASLVQSGHDISAFDQYHEQLNDGLLVFYALDTEHNIRYLTAKEVESLGMKKDKLRELAISNLDASLPKINREGANGLYMLTAGGTYEASLLLFEQIWDKKNFDVKGDILIAIPSRDMLLVTGTEDNESIAKVKSLCKEIIKEGGYTLTDQLFKRTDNKWSPVEL